MNPIDLIKKANEVELALFESGGEITAAIETDLLLVQSNVDALSGVCERLELYGKSWIGKAAKAEKIGKSLLEVRKRLRERLKDGMVAMGNKELRGNDTRFVLVECAKRLEIDERTLAQEWKTVESKWVPDKEAIKIALSEGDTIPGAKLEGGYYIIEYPNRQHKIPAVFEG